MSKSNISLNALRRALQQQVNLGKRLVALSEAQNAAILQRDLMQLQRLEREQTDCLTALSASEDVRAQAANELAVALGLESGTNLAALLPRLPSRDQEALQSLRSQALEIQRKLETLQDRNAALLENALDYVQFNLELLTTAALKPAAYGANLARIVAPTFYVDSQA